MNFDQLICEGRADTQALQRINLNDVIVPTPSNIQQQYLIRRLLVNQCPTLVVGPTGSGKTAVIKNYISNCKEDQKWLMPLLMTFSANTQAGQVQEFMDQKLEKRRRGIFGPPAGKKYVFYIDDLNLPMKERYGCINSHELVRQMIAHGGWYDLKELQFKNVVDTTVVSSMCPAGGSRNPVTQRLLRHFNVIDFLDVGPEQQRSIFGQIVGWWAAKQFDAVVVKDAGAKLQAAARRLVDMGVSVYDRVRAGLLPTPSKEHYTFNLRDLSKLFQGFMMVDPKSVYLDAKKTAEGGQSVFYDTAEAVTRLVRAFVYETERVFADRLVADDDREWLRGQIDAQLQKHIGAKLRDVAGEGGMDDVLFGDFLAPAGQKGGYAQIDDREALQRTL